MTRVFLFVVFFGIGAATLATSILGDDLLQYYGNKQLLKKAEESLTKLKSLNNDYDALLKNLQEDPNLIKRIAPATLGRQPADANTIYPKATPEQLAAARQALTKDLARKAVEPTMPDWIVRCSQPRYRIALFLAGAALILISLICFGPDR